MGERVGATHGINAQGEGLTRAVLELTDGIEVNHAFVCINPQATLLPAFRATTKGGNVVVTALTPDSLEEITIPPLELFVTQKAIMGAVYGFASPRLQIPELLVLYRKGALKLRKLITQTYHLDEINRGYADLDAGKICVASCYLMAKHRRRSDYPPLAPSRQLVWCNDMSGDGSCNGVVRLFVSHRYA